VRGTEHLKVVDVDSGSRHEGLVTEDGNVYTWGSGGHGNLGHGDFLDRFCVSGFLSNFI
jgi:alpha-tubulin suppressor-like RCC1 family protein